MGCRRGERCLGHCLSVCIIFLFSRCWGYHVSAAVYLGGFTPSEVGWSPSEVRCSPLEVFFICYWSGDGMSPGVLARVSRWWLRDVSHSARGCVGFVEVWDWGSVLSGNVCALSLNTIFNVSSACV